MSHSPADSPPGVAAVLVLGTDAVLLARPMSAARLAEACRRAGYESVIPSTWGDELVATACLAALPASVPSPTALCACPLAAPELAAMHPDVERIDLAPPPVAAARYARELFGDRPVHVTYAGRCPGADHPAIDARLTPEALLDSLREGAGLTPERVAAEADAQRADVVHGSERRFRSLPGGAPEAQWLADAAGYTLDDGGPMPESPRALTLYDVAVYAGCACAGAASVEADRPAAARALVTDGEPDRGIAPPLADDRATQVASVSGTAPASTVPSPSRDTKQTRRLSASVGDKPAAAAPGAARPRRTPDGQAEIGTLVLPNRKPKDGRSRDARAGAPRDLSDRPDPIRPHKSDQPLWDRRDWRFPTFTAGVLVLLVAVGVAVYLNRPRQVVPALGGVAMGRAPVARPALPKVGGPGAPADLGALADSNLFAAPSAVFAASARVAADDSAAAADSVARRAAAALRADPVALALARDSVARAESARAVRAARAARLAREAREAAARGPRPVAPGADSAAALAQAAELRREIERRRARVDSLARRVDSLSAAERRARPAVTPAAPAAPAVPGRPATAPPE